VTLIGELVDNDANLLRCVIV